MMRSKAHNSSSNTQQGYERYSDIDIILAQGAVQLTASQLFPKLRSDMRIIKEQYRQLVLDGQSRENDEVARQLYDNYYMLEREGKLLLKADRYIVQSCTEKEQLPMLGEAVLLACIEAGALDNGAVMNTIQQIQQKRYVTSMELDNIIWAFRYCILDRITFMLSGGDEVGPEIGVLIGLLASSDTIDMQGITEKLNPLELAYSEDPAGVYTQMSEDTRWIYRNKTSRLAIRLNETETELASSFLEQGARGKTLRSRHVGEYIYREYGAGGRALSKGRYITMLWLLPAVATLGLGAIFYIVWGGYGSWLACLGIYFPIWAAVKPLCDYICMKRAEHERLPRLELMDGVPEHARTLVVVSTLLTGAGEVAGLRDRLYKLYYANPAENIAFCILADLREAEMPVMPEDRTILHSAAKLINHLNAELGAHFMLIVRNRTFLPSSGKYVGYERKRGAIEQLIALIKGENIPMAAYVGDRDFLSQVKYICALDSDTIAPMDSIAELVSVALHPLNTPEIVKGRVERGYGIIAPRMVTDLRSSLKTSFAKIVGGVGGSSAYDSFCADIYQDAFGEGIFAGKGLIDTDCFHRLMRGLLPDERILSHDILEGGVLRCGFVGDVEFYDAFPKNGVAYFKRLHRWIRGDIQNMPYIMGKVSDHTGKNKIKNPLGRLSRFKLFDNVRRCITPIIIFGCFIAGAFIPGPASWQLSIAAFAGVLLPYLTGFVPALMSGGLFTLSQRYYSGVIPHTVQLFYQSLYALILLPQTAVISFDATVRALYRRFISHKKLLEWTTAAQTERNTGPMSAKLRFYAIAQVLGMLLLLSGHWVSRVAGIFFTLMIWLVVYSDKEYTSPKQRINPYQRQELLSQVAAMWQFYEDFAGAQDNFLPPDNVQKAPIFAVAHRTSPTNIGLYLLSILAARDFDLIDSEGLHRRINRTLSTIEKLPKWHGSLYNWYDTQTLALLEPAYVSSVDSGNFACCLVALKEGLREYVGEFSKLQDIIERLISIIEQTDLSKFYDRKKKLLTIGYDASSEKYSPNHYDLLMSEARMTSFFAIARRQVPPKHWRSLGRTMARLGSYAGPVSWTGTMFEYFMPELLLRCEEGSMGYEGLRFCLHSQKKRAKDAHVPFGMSESAYYAFDSQLYYQYKAHGVQKLGLKRGLDEEIVVSPYSSYITISHDFAAAYANLERMRHMGMFSNYGFYEAVDFTPSRVGRGANAFAIIKSYMAHHVGMSIVACDNALLDNRMQ